MCLISQYVFHHSMQVANIILTAVTVSAEYFNSSQAQCRAFSVSLRSAVSKDVSSLTTQQQSKIIEFEMSFYTRGDLGFYIAQFSNNYLKELVYWSLNKDIACRIANLILDINDGAGREFRYGHTTLAEIERDLNNAESNTVLGFECHPGYSKREIVNQYHDKNFPVKDNSRIEKSDVYKHFVAFEFLCQKHNSIILALMNLCMVIEKHQ